MEQDKEKIEKLKEVLAAYDANKDGKIDLDEMKRIREDFQAKKGQHHNFLSSYDSDKDGVLNDAEFELFHSDLKTTDTAVRYAVAPRFLVQLARYAAYTSDVGESFRPIVSPLIVRASYGISWAYVLGDVAFEGYKERQRETDNLGIARTVAERAVFQSLASMAFPAFLIHSQVKIFSKVFKRMGRFQKWEIGRAVQQECRDRSRMPSSA
eukprot:TRINITY_DN54901_c0_g1_i4.p1 TRINITY_DN54901_c0_g1~~TRINITY_DN54901_c0_g1_i4.p1  ORF type:complete len:210 (-),score=29.17 TRINITY_DN54901_c0_g1_i4:11-640(-)